MTYHDMLAHLTDMEHVIFFVFGVLLGGAISGLPQLFRSSKPVTVIISFDGIREK
jgi:hypothetical protein